MVGKPLHLMLPVLKCKGHFVALLADRRSPFLVSSSVVD